MNIEELQREYAVEIYRRHLLWQLSDVTDEWDVYVEASSEHEDRLKSICQQYQQKGGYAYDRTISGFNAGDESHYEIDEAAEDEFGIRLQGDSEAGTLFINVDSRYEEKVIEWLHGKYPLLEFTVEDAIEVSIPKIFNAPSAERFLRGLKK